MNIDRTLDLRGYHCPTLEMITGSTLSRLSRGTALKIVVDDQGALDSIIRLAQARDFAIVEKGSGKGRSYCVVRI